MTVYSQIQSKHRYIKNEVSGALMLGVSKDEQALIGFCLDENGNIPLIFPSLKRMGSAKKIIFGTGDEQIFIKNVDNLWQLKKIIFSGDGQGELKFWKNGNVLFTLQNSYFNRTLILDIPIDFAEGDILEITVRNTSICKNTNTYECYFFYDGE
jgi:hypothetical protein